MAANSIGMSVPGATDLGLGDMLGQQVKEETDDERKKRMAAMAQNRFGIGASSLGLGGAGMGSGLPGGGMGGY